MLRDIHIATMDPGLAWMIRLGAPYSPEDAPRRRPDGRPYGAGVLTMTQELVSHLADVDRAVITGKFKAFHVSPKLKELLEGAG